MEPLFFTLGCNDHLAKELAEILHIEFSPDNVTHFADGETFARPNVDVDGRDCFIIHSISRPVNERLMDLLIFLDGLHNGGANHVSVIMPYFGYARQDRELQRGDPISGYLVIRLLQSVFVNEIACIDFHSQRLFNRFELDKTDLSAVDLLAQAVKKDLLAKGVSEDICCISPDHGGKDRAIRFARSFPNSVTAYATKKRPEPNAAHIEELHGDVNGKHCIIVDDICDTGGTLSEVIKTIRKEGALSIYVAVTHGVFSGPAIERLNAANLDGIYVTNTVELLNRVNEINNVHIVSVAPILADLLKPRLKGE